MEVSLSNSRAISIDVEFIALDGHKRRQDFPSGIRENKQKWFFLGIFTLGLFALGVIVGRIFRELYQVKRSERRWCVCCVSMS